ncbi:MAG: Rrf2 family transcriptional regulator [Clostridia bacterium]|jgi:Rrf2 family protein|nr:Rrf2 family transcriptional regulator [Clostridia bacterium]
MLITREIDYAIRVVRALSDMNIHSASYVEKAEAVPTSFAYKIFKKLSKSGIVEIIRGPNGGYRLAKKCDELNLFDIISSVDNDFVINECMREGYVCTREDKMCTVHNELKRVQQVLTDELKRKSLSEVLKLK